MKRNAKQKRKDLQMCYEIPEMSERFGAFVVVEGFQAAVKLAEENGVTAVWEVRRGFVLMPTGRIWGLIHGEWIEIPDDYRCCSCAECAVTAPVRH